MIALYQRLLSRCDTVNQINRLHITLENRMTPLEVDALRGAFPLPPRLLVRVRRVIQILRCRLLSKFSAGFRTAAVSPRERVWAARLWVDDLAANMALSGNSRAKSFVRRRLRRDVSLYSAGGVRSSKILLIGFAGRARRFMMPLPVFLQHIDAAKVDVALLLDSKRNGYRSGIGGVAETFGRSLDAIRGLLELDKYRSVVSIGTSGGGMPAVLAALRLGLEAAMSAGGNGPDDPRWANFRGIGLRELIACYRSNAARDPRVFLLFGAYSRKDKSAAAALAEVVPAQLLSVTDPAAPVGHNAFYYLVRRGEFFDFLERTIFAEQGPETRHQDPATEAITEMQTSN